ncbi:MAG TPA: hypothetical protein VF997_12970 [Polyangia bacterium]
MRPAPTAALALAAALAAAACTKTGPQQCPSLERPSARSQVGAVLVPATNQIYALGGQGPQLPLDELWRYSFGACGGWARLVLASSPGPRAAYAAAFDDMRSRIVYIGGGASNDVWALDTNRLTFTKLGTVGAPPPVASSEVAAYDAMHDRVVYAGIETFTLEFGGSDQGQWVFSDGTSLRAPASAAVDPTRSLLVAYDAVGLHGFSMLTSTWHDIAIGGGGGAPPAGATLVWNDGGHELLAVAADSVSSIALDAAATTATFTPLPTTNPPPPRTSFAAAVSGTVLWLSGGVTAAGCTLDDLWTLDLGSVAWTNVWPATTCL